jgi:hypothetical protein
MHAIVFSPGNRDVRAFFAGILGIQPPGPGGGWLTFALPRLNLPFIPPATAVTSPASCTTTSSRPRPS